MRLPGVFTHTHHPRRFLIDDQLTTRGGAVSLVPDTRPPSGLPRIEAGTVLVRAWGETRYVVATDSRAEVSRSAEVSSQEPVGPVWANTLITVSLSAGLGYTFVMADPTPDTASAADQLNQAPVFQAHFLADEDSVGRLRIRTRQASSLAFLRVISSRPEAFGPKGQAAVGANADVRVAADAADLLGLDGSPIESAVPTLLRGHFDTAQLLALTPESQAVLTRRGSHFA